MRAGALDDLIVRTDDFRDEQRWPQYSPAVVELGVLSGLSFKLYTADRTAGALNLFGFEPKPSDAEAETIGDGARRARRGGDPGQPSGRAAAVGAVDQGPHRPGQGHHHGALRRRRRPAFEMLRAVAGQQTRLIDVAQRVIDTRGSH